VSIGIYRHQATSFVGNLDGKRYPSSAEKSFTVNRFWAMTVKM
jgi:hypothetical protein